MCATRATAAQSGPHSWSPHSVHGSHDALEARLWEARARTAATAEQLTRHTLFTLWAREKTGECFQFLNHQLAPSLRAPACSCEVARSSQSCCRRGSERQTRRRRLHVRQRPPTCWRSAANL